MSWLSFEGLRGVVRCITGTLAGTSLADLLYSLAFLRVLKRLRDELSQAGMTWEIDAKGASAYFGGLDLGPESFEVFDASYVDDLVVPVVASAPNLVAKLSETAAILVRVFSLFGFQVNFSRGNTEAMLFFKGAGAITAERHLSHTLGSVIEFEVQFFGRWRAHSKKSPQLGVSSCWQRRTISMLGRGWRLAKRLCLKFGNVLQLCSTRLDL